MQPAKYSSILSAFMKIELCQFTFGFIWAFKEKVGGRCRLCTGWANWTWQQNPSARQSAGASFVAGFSIGLKDTLVLSLYPHFWHAFISCAAEKRACRVSASAKRACDICEFTVQCGQAELKHATRDTRHASTMSSLTRRPVGGDASPVPVVHKWWQPVPQGRPAAIGCPVKRL